MTSREAMLFMKYEHYGKCKDSFKDSQRKCKYIIMTANENPHISVKQDIGDENQWARKLT